MSNFLRNIALYCQDKETLLHPCKLGDLPYFFHDGKSHQSSYHFGTKPRRSVFESHTSKIYVFANHKPPMSQPHIHSISWYEISREHRCQCVSSSVCLMLSFLVMHSSPEEICNAIWESPFLPASNFKSTLRATHLLLGLST